MSTWHSWGDCTCPAHTIVEIRVDQPFQDGMKCPCCGKPLHYRGFWPATEPGYGGSTDGIEAISFHARRLAEHLESDSLYMKSLREAIEIYDERMRVLSEK